MTGRAAFTVRRYASVPSIRSAIRLMAAEEAWLKWRYVGNLRRAVERNESKLAWKARLVTASTACLMAAVTIVGAYLLSEIWTR
jgi:hypothetical protein